MRSNERQREPAPTNSGARIKVLRLFIIAVGLILIGRLFFLQIISYRAYAALATGQHDLLKSLFPERGEIVIGDRSGKIFPLATNQDLYLLYAEPNRITDPQLAAEKIASTLGMATEDVLPRLNRPDDPYEPIKHGLTGDEKDTIEAFKLDGISLRQERARFYPEPLLGGQLVGFVGSDEKGNLAGRYGLEAFFERELAGEPGYVRGGKDIRGGWIPVGSGEVEPARHGDTLVLTIDRSIQYTVCSKLRSAVKKHGASGGSVVILDPQDGAVLAMCSSPDFDPNEFVRAMDPAVFQNPVVSAQYEPGSIMKPLTMAAALDAGAVTAETTYQDTGTVKIGPEVIHNSENKTYGTQTMAQVLEQSINTGAVFAMRRAGADTFKKMIRALGFGSKTGIELPAEATGDAKSLDGQGEIYAATASFGQGIAVTPLQMVRAFAAIANNGIIPSPHIIKEIRKPDGRVLPHVSTPGVRVMSERTATVLGGMLMGVVERGHGKRAKVRGYFVGGKTGTAQIPKPSGGYYEDRTVGSFVGFAPVDRPRFVMLTKIDHPKDVRFAESSAAPLFGEIASFLLPYLEIPPNVK